MTTIKANCREKLNADDFQFISTAIADHAECSASLAELLTDAEARDAALESKRLLHALQACSHPVPVSPHLYFYVLTRNSLGNFERDVADYIACVLAEFLDMRRVRTMPDHPEHSADYVTDMLAVLPSASSERAFLVQTHLGNYSLFISGIFPQHIHRKAARSGAPDISFFEKIGSANYRLASDHHLARTHSLTDVYRTISHHFSEVRQGLNHLSDELLHFESYRAPHR